MKSPFKFLDAYTLADRQVFFGREQEIDDLYKMVFKTPLLLVYGLSGTGKTSLIQCGLAGRFDGPDWYPLFIRRNADITNSINQMMREATKGQEEELSKAVAYLFNYYLRPVYLVFDQFEELFIMGTKQEQDTFMESVRALLAAGLPCKIILVLREEYIGQLYDFEKIIPTLFDFRLRVERMNAAKVKEVMSSSFANFNISLEEPADERLEEMIDNISAGKSGIQLPYLQVYLDMLYREDYKRAYGEEEKELPPLVFTQQEIERFGKIGDVLEKFLQEQESGLQTELTAKYKDLPGDVVRKMLDVFVTEEGTKRPVYYERLGGHVKLEPRIRELLSGIPEQTLSDGLKALEKRRLLRFSNDSIELAHDSLAALIDQQRSDEQRALNEAKRRLKNNYAEHLQTGEFLSRKQLNTYEDLVPLLDLDPEISNFVRQSKKHVEALEQQERLKQQKELRRQRIVSTVISGIALVAVVLGGWAYNQRNIAVEAKKSLSGQLFQNQIDIGKSFKVDGNYDQALQQLAKADSFALDAAQHGEVEELRGQWSRLSALVAEAEELRADRAGWITALENYKQALAISEDGLLKSKKDKLEDEITAEYNFLIESARGMRAFTDPCDPRVLKVLEDALLLSPGEKALANEIAGCAHF